MSAEQGHQLIREADAAPAGAGADGGGELLGVATPYPGGLRVYTAAGREIGCASGYEAAGGLLALYAGYRPVTGVGR